MALTEGLRESANCWLLGNEPKCIEIVAMWFGRNHFAPWNVPRKWGEISKDCHNGYNLAEIMRDYFRKGNRRSEYTVTVVLSPLCNIPLCRCVNFGSFATGLVDYWISLPTALSLVLVATGLFVSRLQKRFARTSCVSSVVSTCFVCGVFLLLLRLASLDVSPMGLTQRVVSKREHL